MQSLRASIAGGFVCFLVCTVAVAQPGPNSESTGKSDLLAQNSKPSELENKKPGSAAKKARKDTQPQPSKSTGKKPGAGVESSENAADASGTPDGSAGTAGGPPGNPKIAEPNWSIHKLRLAPHGAAKYTRNAVTLAPTEGQTLVEASFHLTALRADHKAVDRYSRVWNNVNRKDLLGRAKAGVRLLESRNIALLNAEGRHFPAIWSLDEGIRTTIITANFAPNSQSSQSSSSGNVSPTSHWLDAEQSFLTRTTTRFNQPPLIEYATVFAGLLRTDDDFPVAFLFSIPASMELNSLRLSIDNEIFAIEE